MRTRETIAAASLGLIALFVSAAALAGAAAPKHTTGIAAFRPATAPVVDVRLTVPIHIRPDMNADDVADLVSQGTLLPAPSTCFLALSAIAFWPRRARRA